MSLFAARLIIVALTIIMFCLSLNPFNFAGFYIVFRPTIQPFAYLHYPLWSSIPLTSIFAVVFIFYAIIDSTKNKNKLIIGNIFPLYLFCFFSVISYI